jgi:hypothetical protein
MVLTWCKMLARAIRGHLRTEAQPEPRPSWRGEPLAAVGKSAPSTDPYRTLSLVWVPDGPANSPTTGSPPIPPAPDAPGPGGLPRPSSGPTGWSLKRFIRGRNRRCRT